MTDKGDELGRLRLLDEIVLNLNRGRSLEEVFNMIFDRLHPFVPYHRIAIALSDARGERLSILCARSDGKVVMGRGYAGQVAGSSLEPLIREGRTRIINDLQAYLDAKPESESTRLIVKEGMRSSLTLPLQIAGDAIGVIFFSSRDVDAYQPEHEDFLRSIAAHMALAIDKSRLMDASREKSEYLENILHNSADAIVVIDRQGRIQTWNDGARVMFGYRADEVIGRDYGLLESEEARGAGTWTQEQVERIGFLKDHETVRATKDGRRLTVSLTATLIKDAGGRLIGRSCIVRDVTHVKRLQQELVASQSLAAVGELAATVAHEIKNPLAGISGAIQIIAQGTSDTDPRRGVMKDVLDQIERLDRTVRDLLHFARPAVPAKEDVDLGDSLQRAWTLVAAQPTASGIRFRMEGASGVRLPADPQLLHQVWLNLFQNAIEAMPKGGDLSVQVRDASPALVEVTNLGSGLKPELAEKIFKPFFTTKTRGTGLGLPITRKIVQAHGGRVWAESSPSAKTTTFFVEMPR